jgi:hypothetical protein
MVLALRWEAALLVRDGQPLLDLTLFKYAVVKKTTVGSRRGLAVSYSFMFCLTLALQVGLGLSPVQAGYTFAPLALAFAAASMVAPRRVARHGAGLVIAGIFVAGLGLLALLIIVGLSGTETTTLRLVGPLALVGLGNGLAVPVLAG